MVKSLKTLGYLLTSLSIFCLSLQLYLWHKYQESLSFIQKSISKNPSSFPPFPKSDPGSLLPWLKLFFGSSNFIYLNGELEPRKASYCIDPLTGYNFDCLCLQRKVEKNQFYSTRSGKLKTRWSTTHIDSSSFPPSKRNNIWILTHDFFFPKRFCSLNSFKVKIKDLRKNLVFRQAQFFAPSRMVDEEDPPQNSINSVLLLNKWPSSEFLNVIFKPEENEMKMDESGSLFFKTLSHGHYKVTYWVARFKQRVSLIGKYEQDRVSPFCEVFSEPGDVDVEDLLKKIDSRFNFRVFGGFFTFLLFGASLIRIG